MNVTELARQLNTTREELLEKLPSFGFDIGRRAIKIDNAVADRIKSSWAQGARTDRLVAKMNKQKEAQSKENSQLNKDSGVKEKISIPDKIAVTDLAVLVRVPVTRLIGYLMKQGIMATLNEQIDFDTASIVAEDYGFEAQPGSRVPKKSRGQKEELKDLRKIIAADKGGVARPPVVVIMGHVDHGKTTLLDAIRKTNVVGGESGGITQHIGAYQVEEKGRLITFLDTPGHEAFKSMRERGGQVADVAILLVAADDGLKPQTLESINVIQKENLPFVVAINKIDKPGADVEKVKKELAEINLNPEDWGGKTICVPVSAKAGDNIHELLDMVLLVADMEKLTACVDCGACGVIIESHIDPGEGAVATVLINMGTLRVGDGIVIGDTYGKVKSLKDWQGSDVDRATPSMPVKILGLKSSPRVGDILKVEAIDREKRKKASKRRRLVDVGEARITNAEAEDSEDEDKNVKETLTIIVKADVLGSLEALLASIKKFESPDISINIIKQGLGNITESDFALAEDAGAVIYGFNCQLSAEALKMSYRGKVQIQLSKIIYELLDDVEERVKFLKKIEIVEVSQGELQVLKVFKDSRSQSIIGGRVKKAKITKQAKFRLMREGSPIDEGKIVELQINKQPVEEVREGVECGMGVSGVRGIKEGDILDCFAEEERVSA